MNDRMEQCDVVLIGSEEWENLGLRYIAAYLLQNGVKTEIIPYNEVAKEDILARILRLKPKIVGLSLIFQRLLHEYSELISFLRQGGVAAHFTMGGHFPTVEYRSILEIVTGLDSIVRCEGEETMLELYRHLQEPLEWQRIKGLAYRAGTEINATPPRPLIKDLDTIPFPLRSERVMTHRGIGISTILGSRGCYYDCSFCSIRQFYNQAEGQKRRSRSPANVAEEMEQLHKGYGVSIFIFEDDDFLPGRHRQRDWVTGFVAELHRRQMHDKVIWRISCRIDDIEADLLTPMKEAGLVSVYLGIESGNERGLTIYNKHYQVNDINDTITMLDKAEMPFEFGFMLLNPDTTFDMIKQDIEFLKVIGASGHAIVHFTKMLPYAGTPIQQRLKNEDRMDGDLAFPDYRFTDPRIDLFQMFLTDAFHFRNFDPHGLVERLRHAKLDALVLDKFFHTDYDTVCYQRRLADLIRASNAVCLEKMSMAANFMSKRGEEEILTYWPLLQRLAREEREAETVLASDLDRLGGEYGLYQ